MRAHWVQPASLLFAFGFSPGDDENDSIGLPCFVSKQITSFSFAAKQWVSVAVKEDTHVVETSLYHPSSGSSLSPSAHNVLLHIRNIIENLESMQFLLTQRPNYFKGTTSWKLFARFCNSGGVSQSLEIEFKLITFRNSLSSLVQLNMISTMTFHRCAGDPKLYNITMPSSWMTQRKRIRSV